MLAAEKMTQEQGRAQEAEAAVSRANIYQLLSQVFLREIPVAWIQAMREGDWAQTLEELGFPFDEIKAPGREEDVAAELALAFYKTFIHPENSGMFPIESVQRHGCLQGDVFLEVERFYQDNGWDMSATSTQFADHLGVELEFMAALSAQEGNHWATGEEEMAERIRDTQREFMRKHILVWVPRFAKTLEKNAGHPFYRKLGKWVFQYMRDEAEDLNVITAF